jgi:hypothetical protein
MSYYQSVSDDHKYHDRGVLPDYPITHTIEDLMAGRDKDMELALSLARGETAGSAKKAGRASPVKWP